MLLWAGGRRGGMKEVNSCNFSTALQSRLFNLKPEIAMGFCLRKDTVMLSGGNTKHVSPTSLCSQAEHCVAPHACMAMRWALVGHWALTGRAPAPTQSLLDTPEKRLCRGCLCRSASYNKVQGSQTKLEWKLLVKIHVFRKNSHRIISLPSFS